MYSNSFKNFDYVLFCLSLCIPMFISIYFGYFKNKNKTGKEYLFGKHNLNAWTAGLSLFSGTCSSLAMLGTASEVYIFGSQFMLVSIGSLLSTFVVWTFILPVFAGNLNLQTPYEYFQLRFDNKIRIIMSMLCIFHSICFISVILYTSTLPFSEATGISLETCTTIVGFICTVYTLIGGFIGVIWTDVLQASLMLLSCIFVMFKGVTESGGIITVYTTADEGQRIQFFNFDPNPFQRLTFWSATLGAIFVVSAFCGCTPGALQRCMAVNTEKGARITCAVANGGYAVQVFMAGIIGLSIFAKYHNCDPISNQDITSSSQLLPYFVSDIAGNIPGFVGFFCAGLLSAGLSTISADMNVVSGMVYYDILPNIIKLDNTKLSDVFIMKISVFIYGIILMILAPIMAKSKYIYQVALNLSSLTYAPVVGVTLLGTSIPMTNSKGTLAGILFSLITIGSLIFGSFSMDLGSEYALPVSTSNCTTFTNITTIFNATVHANKQIPLFYKLSFMYYSVFGVTVTILVAVIVSLITGKNNVHNMNPHLIIPSLRVQSKNNIQMTVVSNCD